MATKSRSLLHLVFLWMLFLHSALAYKDVYRAPIEDLNESDLNKKVEIAIEIFDGLKLHESIISDISEVTPGTPAYGYLLSYKPDVEAIKLGRYGLLATKATQLIIATHCFGRITYRNDCAKKTSWYSMKGTAIESACERNQLDCDKHVTSRYRSINGACYNKKSLGMSYGPYQRLFPATYVDTIEGIRRAKDKSELPNAREITSLLTKFEENNHDRLTMAVLQWGQFLEEDLSRSAYAVMMHFDKSFKCCKDNGRFLMPRYRHKYCNPISISNDDYYSRSLQHCMNYARSLPAVDIDCKFGPQQQMNQATSFLDGSQIYGTSFNKSRSLRDFAHGELKMTVLNGKEYLPVSVNPNRDCLYTEPNDDPLCFISGDPRVNFEPQTVVMHTLWAREHNRVARELKKLNGNKLSKEELFEETRRIVIAEMQHVTYNEWAKEVLPHKYSNQLDKITKYHEDVNPAVLNSVGVAVFSAFKSMYPNKLSLISENRDRTANIDLKSHYFKPNIFRNASAFDDLVRGIASQTIGRLDMNFNKDLINNLYTNGDMGYDILSLDIQRGRDHGITPYNHVRKYIGFKEAEHFHDFHDVMSKEDYIALSKVYNHPDDVDLVVGGLMERPMAGSIFGNTFSWLLSNQLWKLKEGDRFFYTHSTPYSFTTRQLEELEKVSFARILCDNSDNLKMMQRNAFEVIGDKNPLLTCIGNDIPRMNLSAWIIQ